MTLEFLQEKGLCEEAAQEILARFSEKMAEKQEEHEGILSRAQAQAAQREDELGKEVSMLKCEIRERKVDGLLHDSGIRSSLVREAVRRAMLALDGGEEEYLSSLRKSEPELFEGGCPRFICVDGEGEASPSHLGLRFVKGGGE